MHPNRRDVLKLVAASGLAGTAPALLAKADAAKIRVAMVVRALGVGFFDACRDGGMEACKELGNVDLIYAGPAKAGAAEQIQVIESLIDQKVEALAVSAADPTALVPVARKAMRQGIKVISFDSAIAPQGRILQLDPSSATLVGERCLQMMAKTLDYRGNVAILSAGAEASSQNAWIAAMKREWVKPAYDRLKLVAVVHGDEQADRSYREAQDLIKAHADLEGIIAPTSVGIVAAAKAVMDGGLVGKVHVTGLGLPSEMRVAVEAGATETFAMWNPIDLGYAATMIAAQIALGQATGAPGTTIHAGRMGDIAIGSDGSAAMAQPFIFDKTNIEKYAKLF